MKLNCPDCRAIAAVTWFIAFPEIWRCGACGTLLQPQEVQQLKSATTGKHRKV